MDLVDPIILRSTRQSYIVFCAILGPVAILAAYAAIISGGVRNFGMPLIAVFLLGAPLYFFYSLKLALAEDRLTYNVVWRSESVAVQNIKAIQRGRGPFGVGATWIVHCTDRAAPIIVNVTNFNAYEVKALSMALMEKAPNVRFSPARR